ncbi:MAG: hypothetical protein MZW92_67490 [Comamonadaceae bacterium]|nr:hypothetical protein [Comamonadaceae bacterium]
MGRPPQLHRGAARHPDHRAGAAARWRPTDGPRLLYEWLAEKLADKLRRRHRRAAAAAARSTTSSAGTSAARGRREEAYTRMRGDPARAQRSRRRTRCASSRQITDFDLFVTTTFDPLLEQAINAERFGGAQSTPRSIAYAPNRVADLPAEREPAAAAGRLPPARPAARPRPPTSSPTRTCWSSSARCRAST